MEFNGIYLLVLTLLAEDERAIGQTDCGIRTFIYRILEDRKEDVSKVKSGKHKLAFNMVASDTLLYLGQESWGALASHEELYAVF